MWKLSARLPRTSASTTPRLTSAEKSLIENTDGIRFGGSRSFLPKQKAKVLYLTNTLDNYTPTSLNSRAGQQIACNNQAIKITISAWKNTL
jgi:hypothetical protein